MKYALIGVVAVLLAQFAGSSSGQVPKVAVKDVRKHVGREVMACGRVVTYDCENASGSLVLDLDSPWTRRNGASVELPRKHWPDNLGRGLSNRYLFANVCARGKVQKAGNRYRLVVDRHDAIDVTGRPAVHPRRSPSTPSKAAPKASSVRFCSARSSRRTRSGR